MNDEKDLMNQGMPEEENDVVETETAAEDVLNAVESINDESDACCAEDTEDETVSVLSGDDQNSDETGNNCFSEESVVPEIPEKKSEISKPAVAAISAAITLVVCAAACFTWYMTSYNTYNANKNGYAVDLATYARMYGQSVDEMKEQYGLPEKMRDDTIMEIASNYVPASKMAELNGMTLDELKKAAGIEDMDLEEGTYWGEVSKSMREQQLSQMEEEKEATETDEEDADFEDEDLESDIDADEATEESAGTEATE